MSDDRLAGLLSLALPDYQAPRGGLDFRQIFRTLRARAYVLLIVAVFGGFAGYALQRAISPRYTSTTEILLDPRRADAFGADASFANIYVDSAKIASVVSIIDSSELLGRVVRSEKLADDPEFGGPRHPWLEKWRSLLPFLPAPDVSTGPQARERRALERLTKAVRVEREGTTYVLTVAVSARSPQRAQQLARAVADAYLKDQIDTKILAAQQDTDWLNARLSELRQKLEDSERKVEAVRTKYGLEVGGLADRQFDAWRRNLGLASSASNNTLSPEEASVAALRTQLLNAQQEIAVRHSQCVQAEQARQSGQSIEGMAEGGQSNVIEQLRLKQADVARQIAALSAHYNDSFPELRRARRDLATIQGRIAAEQARVGETICSIYKIAVARQEALSRELKQAMQAEYAAPGVEGRMQLLQAQREVDANQGLYDSLFDRRREVERQQNRHEAEARIISDADLPEHPSWPKPVLFPLCGVLLGLLCSVGLAIVAPVLRNRFAHVSDVERQLGLPVLASVPPLGRKDLWLKRERLTLVEYSVRRPLSPFAESLRLARALLRLGDIGGNRIVQITSAAPAEGKSTFAAALAISAAKTGLRVILVDADMRRGSLSGMFNLANKDGLIGLATGENLPVTYTQQLGDVSLEVLGVGNAIVPRPDLIASARFAMLLKDLALTYDVIILDTPPVLAVSDAMSIARAADATVLVVDAQKTPKDVAERAVKSLRAAGAQIAGVVLNRHRQTDIGDKHYAQAIAKYYALDALT
ncbi:GumC family protein [Rhodopila globiformis]|nr:polysaccharide biosynthesis tyrosine autokinase [Rhodopila globiformis]